MYLMTKKDGWCWKIPSKRIKQNITGTYNHIGFPSVTSHICITNSTDDHKPQYTELVPTAVIMK